MNKQSYIYLAGPYSHESQGTREHRFAELTNKAGELIKEGFVVYSPITRGHMVAQHCPDIPIEFDWRQEQSLEMLKHVSMMVVLCLDGWRESKCVMGEVSYALDLGIPVEHIEV